MPSLVTLAGAVSIIAFAWHGASLLFGQVMVEDFARYGLAQYRRLVGALHLAGSAGLLLGAWYPPLVTLAGSGLALMMLVAIGYRIQVRDPILAILPAVAFFVLNILIVAASRMSMVP